ncbi:uncharacterized protein ARMOST_02624 [Armillaria ostoyae]|uniref:Uncharacterized protein n=1 Tax=Armillaria ostoyae TaxID=47428 RepID=A0A284QSG8_ARMOS|nr:uncharacterized protein ARMOST_02624 [Armillaria ostoyae]
MSPYSNRIPDLRSWWPQQKNKTGLNLGQEAYNGARSLTAESDSPCHPIPSHCTHIHPAADIQVLLSFGRLTKSTALQGCDNKRGKASLAVTAVLFPPQKQTSPRLAQSTNAPPSIIHFRIAGDVGGPGEPLVDTKNNTLVGSSYRDRRGRTVVGLLYFADEPSERPRNILDIETTMKRLEFAF